jgi:hypothetical protein
LLLLQTSVAAPTCALRCHGRSGSPSLSRLSFSASRFSGDIVYELAAPSRADARGLDLLRCWLRIMVQLTDPQFSASAPIYQAIRISATPRVLSSFITWSENLAPKPFGHVHRLLGKMLGLLQFQQVQMVEHQAAER